MDPIERQRLAFQLFEELCNIPAERQAEELRQRCAGDADLHAEVLRLLSSDAAVATNLADEKVDDFLGRQMDGMGFDLPAESGPETGGSYRIMRVIGEGGMGTVYEAEQVNPRRRVAIKVIRSGRRSPQVIRRFEYEAQVLARLEHPGIARLYEADTKIESRQVQAFLAMELVRGLPIDEFVAKQAMDIPARLRLFLKVCDAIGYAHRMGVIHRDLKPANILVTDDCQPKLLDFGVAQTFGDDKLATTLTQHGQIVGTLPYMSPEQVDGRSAIDTRSDVYALGVVLYKMLTGVLPIDMTDASLATATHKLLNEAPRKLGEYDRKLRGDLELIISHALEKDPRLRYAAVAEFAVDIESYLSGRPIAVRGESRIYILRKSLWRHRRSVLAGGLLLVALLAFGIVSAVQAQRNKHLATAADQARSTAQTRADELRKLLYFSNIGFAQAAIEVNDSPRARMQLDACPPELRNWEWDYLQGQCDMSQSTVRLDGAAPFAVVLSADARYAASAVFPDTINVFNAKTGAHLRQHKLAEGLPQTGLSADGQAYCISSQSNELLCFDVESGRRKWRFAQEESSPLKCRAIHFSRDGSRVLHVCQNLVRVLDVAAGTLVCRVQLLDADYIQAAAIAPDGSAFFTVDCNGRVDKWDAASGQALRRFGDDSLRGNSIAVSLDGSRIAVKCYVGPLIIWDANSGELVRRFDGLLVGVGLLAFGANRDHVYGSCSDYTVRRWSATDLLAPLILRGNSDWTHGMAISPDGNTFYSAALDQTIRRWDLNAPRQNRWFQSAHGPTAGFAMLPSGQQLLAGGDDRKITLYRRSDYRVMRSFTSHDAAIRAIAVNPDGNRFASTDAQGTLLFWRFSAAEPVVKLRGGEGELHALEYSPDGLQLACGDSKGSVRLFDANTGKEVRTIAAAAKPIRSIAFDPTGSRLITAGDDGAVRLWEAVSGRKLAEALIDHDQVVAGYHPRGKLIAAGTSRGEVLLLDGATLKTQRSLVGHRQWLNCVRFMPDGKRLLTAGEDRVVRIWDLDTGAQVLALREAGYAIQRLTLSPDGNEFGVTTTDGRVVFWRSQLPTSDAARPAATTRAVSAE